MNHPIISSANGQARYNDMVQTADNYRRIQQLQQDGQSWPAYLTRLANFLASIVSKSRSEQVADPLTQTS